MPQLRIGRVSIEGGTNRVVGDEDCDWTQAIGKDGFALFGLIGWPTPIVMQTLEDQDESASGNWEMTLAANYDGPDVVDGEYRIHIDFEPLKNLALFAAGDAFGFQLMNRNTLIMAGEVGGGIGVSGGAGVQEISGLAAMDIKPVALIEAPKTYVVTDTFGGNQIAQLWQLQDGVPVAGSADRPTFDDAGKRWRQTL